MQLKRPGLLSVELRDCPERALANLLASAGAAGSAARWYVQAAHLGVEVAVEAEDLHLLADLPADATRARADLEAAFGAGRVARLVDAGLLIGDHEAHAQLRRSDEALRRTDWWGPAAVAHSFGRWDGVDISADELREGKRTVSGLVARNGAPPPEALELKAPEARLALPPPADSALDQLLRARATCRNFDPAAQLSLGDFSTLMHRAFAAQGSLAMDAGAVMLKKNSPSGGGLHPIEAYVLVQRLQGVAPGLYHYHCLQNALEPMAILSAEVAAAQARELVAGQDWFANAPVLVLLAARFQRNFWKYRKHAKSWKVILLDAGHLSQTFYLGATDLGLGAFVTGAINDRCAERLFDLDGLATGAIAVCGVGARAAGGARFEFDPLGKAVR